MEEFARCVGDYVATLLVERPLELLVGAVVVGVWRWFIGREISDLKKQVADMRQDAADMRKRTDNLNKRLDLPERTHQPRPLAQAGGDVNLKIDNSKTINVSQSDVESISEPKIRVMHYGTKHGDFSVRFFSVEQADEDIRNWLIENDLRSGVSRNAIIDVARRAQTSKKH